MKEYMVSSLEGESKIKVTEKECKLGEETYNYSLEGDEVTVVNSDKTYLVERIIDLGNSMYRVHLEGYSIDVEIHDPMSELMSGNGESGGDIYSPMSGVVTSVKVGNDDEVNQGDVLLVLSAMKMENEILSPIHGVVSELSVEVNKQVNSGDLLLKILPLE